MKRSISLRTATAQLQAGAAASFQRLTSAPVLRALLLGGLAVLGTAATALAQDAPSVKAKQADAQGLFLTVENPTRKLMQVKVVSLAKYACLTNEVNHKASYGSQLNFKGVPAGQYAVLVRVGRERYRYNVQVQNDQQTTISVRELTGTQAPAMVASTAR
ncbi:hypothetical protein [Hymenobacter ruricola]|uniref:DUF2846 domain-containing protein n=1 Tax=Hymenobacter ruricola TaxID=2791023 RepID=A0ABS0I7A3_9BACT|nr:hypothetical protein [Hymenobacter ruricola]MBF9222769.1 hypothetical protein [Hymenobacter ruricola]